MALRSVVLLLALLVSVGSFVSLTTDYSEAGPKKSYYKKKKKKKKLKKYSKAWWKWYKAKKKRERQLALRRKLIQKRASLMARKTIRGFKLSQEKQIKGDGAFPYFSSEPLLGGWRRATTRNNETIYILDDGNGRALGTASFAFVAPAKPENEWRKNKTLAGVELSALRRIVIDQMMRQQGWVINDYQKEINGMRTFVVVAESYSQGRNIAHLFYFTEVDGKIYSLVANSSPDAATSLAESVEKMLANFVRTERARLK